MVRIPLSRPLYTEEELNEIEKTLNSGWWTQGPRVEEFERQFAKFVGSRYAVAVSSCTAALHIALLISKQQDVAVPDFTFPSVANSALILRRNLKLLDVNAETYNLDVVNEEGCVVPTHIFGNPCRMDKVKGSFIIEDCACAAGSYFKGRHAGTFGDCGCFSFHPRKLLSTGEGGMLVTNNPEIDEEARMLRDHGRKTNRFVLPGYNFRMSDITAAVGLVQLRHIPEILDRRRKQAQLYTKLISELEVPAVPQKTVAEGVHSYQSYVVTLHKDSRAIIVEMAKHGIETQFGTYALHMQPTFASATLPNSKLLFERTLTLPLYHELTEEEQVYVVECLKKSLG